jgi:hypothetical protein
MSINLEEIVERAVPMSGGHYLAVRAEDFNALVAEVERLRAQRVLSNEDFSRAFDMGLAAGERRERGDAVAWLRGNRACCEHPSYRVSCLSRLAADEIERGEHRREEEP